MKRLSAIFFFASFFCLISVNIFAQDIVYLDADYKPATTANYIYKRVFKYKEPIINPNIGTGYYGGLTVNPQATGLHYCTVTDYYKTGELALIGKIVAGDPNCSQRGGFEGQVVTYYKNGNIRYKAPWQYGKLNGVVVYYDENGNESKREEYVSSKLIDESRFAAPADSPIVGTWKYVEYGTIDSPKFIDGRIVTEKSSYVTRTSTYIYSQNGVVESIHQNSIGTSRIKGNWKYIPKDASSGILEEYRGEDLIERGTVKWLNRNRLEYTITFSESSDIIGNKYLWIRE